MINKHVQGKARWNDKRSLLVSLVSLGHF